MIGQQVSHYEIVERLGKGGMGVVYKAHDSKLDRMVALKFLPEEATGDDEARERFLREAQAASRLDHPNICTVFEIDETKEGQTFIAMAHCDGKSLKEMLSEETPDLATALEIAIQVGKGLAVAHDRGIVHRDIKPGNIMLTVSGMAKIVDFGLAKLQDSAQLTKTGTAMGTTFYMSPEQLQSMEADARSDVWSLGVVLYQMLTGRLPFEGEYEAAIIYSILNTDPLPMTVEGEKIPDALREIVFKALQKNPGGRFASMKEFVMSLQGVLREIEPTASVLMDWLPPSAKSRWNTMPRVVSIAAAAALAVILFFASPTLLNFLRVLTGGMGLPAAKHLAILPFDLIGGKSEDRALCDGLVESLTSRVSALEQYQESLWIVPTSLVQASDVKDPVKAGGALGVSLAVTGSLQRLGGDDVQLTLNLVDIRKRRQLRSVMIEGTEADILALQNDAFEQLLAMLDCEIAEQSRSTVFAGDTEVPDACKYYLQGRGFLQHYQDMQNVDRAIELFNKALEEDEQYALAYAGLGEAGYRKYAATKDDSWVTFCEANSDTALELNKSLPQARVTRGLLYMIRGRNSAAATEFKAALAIDRMNAEAFSNLGRALERQGKIAEAEETLRKAISLKPDMWSFYNSLGTFYARQGNYESAKEQFLKILDLTPDNIKALNNLGSFYYFTEQLEEAEKMYLRSVEIEPNRVAFNNLGVLYYHQKRYTDAAHALEKALVFEDQNNFLTWGNLADAYYIIPEEQAKAMDYYRKAMELAEKERLINPRDPRLLAYLAEYYIKLDKRDSARSLLDQLDLLQFSDVDVFFSAAESRMLLGEKERAVDLLENALRAGLSVERVEENEALKPLLREERLKSVFIK